MDRCNKYQTKAVTRTHIHLHTQLVGGYYNTWLQWVTTKEYHPRLCIEYVDFVARYKCNYITFYGARVSAALLHYVRLSPCLASSIIIIIIIIITRLLTRYLSIAMKLWIV